MPPVVGRRIPLSRIGYVLVIFWLRPECVLDKTLLLDSNNCVFSVFPWDRLAVIDPDRSRNCRNDTKLKRPEKAVVTKGRCRCSGQD